MDATATQEPVSKEEIKDVTPPTTTEETPKPADTNQSDGQAAKPSDKSNRDNKKGES